ncbi:MAG: DUF6279 family lipoprotein [Pseudomonadota bacterium]
MVSTPQMRRLARILLCVVLLLTTSCSSTKFVYNRLDFFLPWYLGRYVDLDKSQSKALDAHLERLLPWHRYEELPAYLNTLADVEESLGSAVTVEQVAYYADEFEQAWYRVRDEAMEVMLDLGETLDQKQIDQFLKKLRKQQKKFERKYLSRSADEVADDAYDDLKDSFSDFLGRLSKDQRQILRNAAGDLVRSDEYWLSERANWISFVADELARTPGWQDRIRATIVNWEEQLDAEALAVYEANTLRVQEAAVQILNSRSEKQDKRLRREIGKLVDDLTELSEKDRL